MCTYFNFQLNPTQVVDILSVVASYALSASYTTLDKLHFRLLKWVQFARGFGLQYIERGVERWLYIMWVLKGVYRMGY